MSPPAYLQHVTVTTGHSRHSLRAECGTEVLALLGPWISHALLPDEPNKAPPVPLPVPELAAYSAHVFTTAGGLLVTVYGPDIVTVPPALPEPIPLVTFAVARKPRHAAKLWSLLLRRGVVAPPPPVMPGTPWVATVLHPTLAAFPDSVDWLGDFTRCVAWTWIERVAD